MIVHVRRYAALCAALGLLIVVAFAMADTDQADRFYSARKYDQAAAAYLEAAKSLEGAARANALYRAGMAYRYASRYEPSIEQLQAAIDTGELDGVNHAGAHLSIGYCLYVQSKFEPAEVKFKLVMADKNASPNTRVDASLYAAYMFNKLGRIDHAIASLNQGYAEPDITDYKRAHTQVVTGQILQRAKRYDEAKAAYQRALDIKGGIGKLRIKAETKIEEIAITLAPDDPFYILPFVTDVSQTHARIAWASKGPFDGGKVTVGSTVADVTTTELPAKGFFLHVATFDDLSPDATCTYHAALADQSRDGSFKTQRTREGAFQFSILGDTQTMAPVHTEVAKNIAKHNPDFVVLVGDFVERGSNWPDWRSQFFGPGQTYLPNTVFWPVRGNHDGGPFYPRLFGLEEGQHYSFDYGNLHVIVLDAFGPGAGGKRRAEQVEWFKADLEANDKQWTIVCLHDPMMGISATNHWYGEEDYLPLVHEYEVDMVFAGHHHIYRRFIPVGLPGKKPTTHITTGGAGGGMGGNLPSPLLVKGKLVHHHLDFTLDDDTLHMRAVAMDGSTLDELTLVKKDGRYQDAVMDKAIDYTTARKISSLFYEMGHITVDDIIMAQHDGEGMKIDTAKLPRGGIDVSTYPPDTQVIIGDQVLPLREGVLRFNGPRKTTINLRIGDRLFEPQEITLQPK